MKIAAKEINKKFVVKVVIKEVILEIVVINKDNIYIKRILIK